MPSVSVLYITDRWVGPHLELIRNVCDPSSTSKPHVTVRYSDHLAFPEPHFETEVRLVDLVDARAFGLEEDSDRSRYTVYVKAESEELANLEFKPDFPQSEFHITLYNGPSKEFAQALLERVRAYNWNFRISLPRRTRLSKIHVSKRRLVGKSRPRDFDSGVKRLFKRITGEELTWTYVRDLSDFHRLDLADEICRHLIQRVSASRVGEEDDFLRNILPHEGAYFPPTDSDIFLTPPELAREVTSYALANLKTKAVDFGDPAIGTGAFFSALMDELKGRNLSSAIGIDINPKHIEIAHRRWAKRGLSTKVADFLHWDELPARNLILANPPYLRHQKIDRDYKEKLRSRASVKTGTMVSGLSGLYVYFLLLCDVWMKQDGIAAWLIPSEFMQTDYGDAVRKYLTERVQLLRIHQYGLDPQFENVLVYPSVVVFRKSSPTPNQNVLMSCGGTLSKPDFSEYRNLSDLHSSRKWAIPNREIVQLSTRLRIKDLFTVKRGLATGANDFFILQRDEALKMELPARFLKPILPKINTLDSDIIERDVDGYPKIENQLCILDVDIPESQLGEFPELKKYLSLADSNGVKERTLVQNRKLWYKQELRAPALYLCTYMGRGKKKIGPPLRFLWNRSDAVAANTYLMLYPKERLAKHLENSPEHQEELFKILNASSKTTMLENSRVHAGGLHKIEPSELLDVRLTREPRWLTNCLEPLLR